MIKDPNTLQGAAQSYFDEIDQLRTSPRVYADYLREQKARFAADCVEDTFLEPTYEHYTWNEGLARAARHYLNEMGSCGTCGDINAMGFR